MNNWLDILSMLGSLALVILVLVLTYYGSRWYARRLGQSGAGKYIKILERISLGAGSTLVIAQIGDEYFLLGVSDKSVRLVSKLPGFERHLEAGPQQPSAPFSQILRQLLDRRGEKKDDGDTQ